MAFLGHLGSLRPLQPMGRNHGPRSMGQLGPFWPNTIIQKGDKGGKPTTPKGQVCPKPQLGPPEPNLAIKHHRTQFGPGSPWTTFQLMAPGNHQRPPDQLSSILPLTLRGILPFLHAPHTQGCRSGAYMVLYTIMHHFSSEIQW
ncbi:hypothetical protein O181_049580 [Austropuccinia psidii MF-1]|uniref:Uncharacterized protein n=1 Tax=Austropuccinia psidii MF-1 TaxID=1389203 RepID=A0A9Q3DTU3_9BASI|nr:hypothetical protein [Austropuccinia psidii MF-1]